MPFTHKFFDAETAHRLGVLAAKYNIVPRKQKTPDSPILVSVLVVKTTIYWSTGHSGHRYKTKSCWFECNQALFWSFDIACSVRRLQRIIMHHNPVVFFLFATPLQVLYMRESKLNKFATSGYHFPLF